MTAVTAAVAGARSAEEIATDASYVSVRIPDALFEELMEFRGCVRW